MRSLAGRLALVAGAGRGIAVQLGAAGPRWITANYRVSIFYDLTKTTVNRMAFALARELKPHDATASPPHFAISETPPTSAAPPTPPATARRRTEPGSR